MEYDELPSDPFPIWSGVKPGSVLAYIDISLINHLQPFPRATSEGSTRHVVAIAQQQCWKTARRQRRTRCVCRILLYGNESWSARARQERHFNSVILCYVRSIFGSNWRDHALNKMSVECINRAKCVRFAELLALEMAWTRPASGQRADHNAGYLEEWSDLPPLQELVLVATCASRTAADNSTETWDTTSANRGKRGALPLASGLQDLKIWGPGARSFHSRAPFGRNQHFCPGHDKNFGAPGLQSPLPTFGTLFSAQVTQAHKTKKHTMDTS